MKLRNLTLIACLLGAFFANSVFALGMGEIKLNSSLNEPLDAEIQLLNVGDLTELEMLVGLGSREDFAAAGVERLFLLTDLRFKVDMSEPGNAILRVSSRKPIREPYLDFLLELQWPSGRLLREYTLLLDLPVYATEGASAKKIKAASSSPQPQQQAPVRTASTTSSSVSAAAKNQSNTSSTGAEYRVASGDTAWGIAKKIKPDDASIMQSLAAVKQSNPHAFIDGNINLLKQGAVLRLPDSAEISRLSQQDVNAEVNFSQPDVAESVSAKPSGPQLDATGDMPEAPSPSPSDGGGRLKLAAPSDEDAMSTSAVSGDGPTGAALGVVDRETEALQNDFAIFQEELDKTQRENEELKARLSIMEEQIATMSRLVEINDDSLRAAQIATQQDDDVETIPLSDADTAEEVVEQTESTVIPVAETEAPVDSAEAPSAEITEESDSSVKSWMDMLLYPLIGLLVVLLAIVLFFRNRKSEEEPEEELSLQTLVTAKEEQTSDEDLDAVLDDEDKQVLDEVAAELEEQDLEGLEELELGEGEDVDPMGEADIYLSLGNYKQAEKVLLDAVEQSPEDASLRLKLMEVYVSSNELDKFDVQYQALADLENAEAGAKADSLRSELASGSSVDQAEDSVEQEAPDDETPEPDALDLDDLNLDSHGEVGSNDEINVSEPALDLDDLDTTASEQGLETELDNLDAEVSELETSDFDLDLDLEDVDLDSLSSDIDEEMDSIDLGLDESSPVEEEPVESLEVEDSVDEDVADEVVIKENSASAVEDDDFEDFDDDLDILEGEDECSTKLELAQAYMEMGDPDSAREILDEVVSLGDDAQQEQARKLLEDVT